MELPQLAELERVQTGILNGISNIDLSLLSPLSKQRPLRRLQRRHGTTEARISAILRPNGPTSSSLKLPRLLRPAYQVPTRQSPCRLYSSPL
ncbi:hypothetical protein OIU79_008485 [Salix purpurea]|uniref:Uncharacterized protein n=1 Tax=Salix purpurea TaxID=77065 RepID=A0A9Q0YW99_SALPP|nr:hypothetical protein OIU79_008485 [Salix purpurea]